MNIAKPNHPTTNPDGQPYACDAWIAAHCEGLRLTQLPLRKTEELWWGDLLCKLTFHVDNNVQSLNGLDLTVGRRTVINDFFVFHVPNLTWVTVSFGEHCAILALLPTPRAKFRPTDDESFELTTRLFVSSNTAGTALRMIGDAVPWPCE